MFYDSGERKNKGIRFQMDFDVFQGNNIPIAGNVTNLYGEGRP